MLRHKIFILITILLHLSSCQNNDDKCIDCDSKPKKTNIISNSELEMYTPSELAALMLNIYSTNEKWKSQIIDGVVPTEIPEEYKSIHSAESVNDKAKSEFFSTMANSYLESVNKVTKSTPETAKGNYNTMINVCISCHKQICHGPIPKIKKLLID